MRWTIPCVILLLSGLGCTPGPDPDLVGERLEREAAAAAGDTLPFAAVLARHQALAPAQRETARAQALAITDNWRDFEREAHEVEDSQLRHWYYETADPTRDHRWVGMGNSIVELRRATALDPSYAEGWAALGRLCAEVGDLPSSLQYLENARVAADAATAEGRPLDPAIQLQILRELAWTLRDLTRWDEGLAVTAAGLRRWPQDPDLTLVRGLLLAGAGRYQEAVSLAVRMPAVEYPQYDFIFRGFKQQRSTFANNWIRAMALLGIGETEQAYHKLGDLPTYAYRAKISHAARFWRDAALLAELAEDPQAPLYYGVGFVNRGYQGFYPAAANNVGAQVLGVPDPRLPVYTSFGQRFYLGGSPFAYVGLQLNLLSQGLFADQRAAAAGRALQMLDLLERRGIRSDWCRAFRGRIFYAGEDYDLAREELAAARTGFLVREQRDAVTDLLLGLIELRAERYEQAAGYLEEALVADDELAVGWRSLGVAYTRLGRGQQAGQAMTQAVKLDPWNVSGLYNLGLYNFQNRQLGPALQDLERALRLDPENREVQRLRDMVAAALEDSGLDPVRIAAGDEGQPAESPEALLDRLQAETEQMLTIPDSLRLGPAETEARIAALQARWRAAPDPVVRAVLALALLNEARLPEVQELLAPGWGVDLSPEEELMLLYADNRIGERVRAEQVMRQALDSGSGSGIPYAVALAARTMRTGTDPVRAELEMRNLVGGHGFFGWWSEAKRNLQASSMMPRFINSMYLYINYRSDPMLEQAVWGMSPTPYSGVSLQPGGGTGHK